MKVINKFLKTGPDNKLLANERYEAWISTYEKGNHIIIDVDNLNFVKNNDDLQEVFLSVDKALKKT